MRKRVGVVSAGIALVAFVAGIVSPALGSASPQSTSTSSVATDPQTIHVVAVFKESAEIDNGAPGFSLGDDVVFSGALRQGGEWVGRLGVVCTFTSVANPDRVEAQCPGTARLQGGQITVQGLVINRQLKVLPITGGSGQYEGASGEMDATILSETRAALTFHLD
jgi:Allene oxide cyclase barrel like domain